MTNIIEKYMIKKIGDCMSKLLKLKILLCIEIIVLFLQFYGLIYMKNNDFLSQFFIIGLCGFICTIGITVQTTFLIKWRNEDENKSK